MAPYSKDEFSTIRAAERARPNLPEAVTAYDAFERVLLIGDFEDLVVDATAVLSLFAYQGFNAEAIRMEMSFKEPDDQKRQADIMLCCAVLSRGTSIGLRGKERMKEEGRTKLRALMDKYSIVQKFDKKDYHRKTISLSRVV